MAKKHKKLSGNSYELISSLITLEIQRINGLKDTARGFLFAPDSLDELDMNIDDYVEDLNKCSDELHYAYHNADEERFELRDLIDKLKENLK